MIARKETAMRRFSIRNLMGLIVAIAVAFAALRGANDHWAGGLVLAFLGLLGYSILASIHRQGAARAVWLGFIVAGGGYFLAVRALPDQERGWLPTSQLLTYVEQQVVGVNSITVNILGAIVNTPLPGTPGTAATSTVTTAPTITTTGGGPAVWNLATTGGGNSIRVVNASGTTVATAWAPFLPGAANGEAFKSVGHSLFALMAGWIGAVVSRRMWKSRELAGDQRLGGLERDRV
jgi:hypothetical protein